MSPASRSRVEELAGQVLAVGLPDPILDAATWLIVPRARLLCPRCGPTVEAVPWLDRYARMTTRFAESVARLAQLLPIKHVAAWFGLSWDTVQAIDQAAMERRLGPIDLTGVRRR